MGEAMQMQIKAHHKGLFKILGGVVVLGVLAVGYLVLTHRPGLTVFIEESSRRAALKDCLDAANVRFEVTDRGGFKALPGSVQRMEVVWREFDGYRVASMEFCRAQKNSASLY